MFRFVPTQSVIENSKKIAKKFNKLKDTVMASFQAKTGWERLRMRENKFSFGSIPTQPGIGNVKKIGKKNQKIKNINMSSSKAKTGTGQAEHERKKKL